MVLQVQKDQCNDGSKKSNFRVVGGDCIRMLRLDVAVMLRSLVDYAFVLLECYSKGN